jgi:hypothetical protein
MRNDMKYQNKFIKKESLLHCDGYIWHSSVGITSKWTIAEHKETILASRAGGVHNVLT